MAHIENKSASGVGKKQVAWIIQLAVGSCGADAEDSHAHRRIFFTRGELTPLRTVSTWDSFVLPEG